MDGALVPDCINRRIAEDERAYSGVGRGWFPLLERLDADLAALIPDYKVAQVKEKFGGLRFYVDYPENSDPVAQERARLLICEAQNASLEICDECGEVGKPRPGRWLVIRCDQHAPPTPQPSP